MWIRLARKAQALVFLGLFLSASIWSPDHLAMAGDTLPIQAEFSGPDLKQANGKKDQAQVSARGDRLRLEFKCAIRIDFA